MNTAEQEQLHIFLPAVLTIWTSEEGERGKRKCFPLKTGGEHHMASELHMNQLLLIQLMTTSPDIKQIRNI